MKVQIEGLSFAYGRQRVLQGITITLGAPVTALVGPNAAGKTTLLRCVAGSLAPQGRVALDGAPLAALHRDERTRLVAYLDQAPAADCALTVLEYVLLGRLARLGWRVGDADLDAALAVMERLGIAPLAMRPVTALSGGQRQIVAIAQVLAQEPLLLLLDEPTNNLDLRRQLVVLELIGELCRREGRQAILALHDLNLAARFADEIVVLSQGEVYDAGPPAQVLTAAMLRRVYGIHAEVTLDAEGIPRIALRRATRLHEEAGAHRHAAQTEASGAAPVVGR